MSAVEKWKTEGKYFSFKGNKIFYRHETGPAETLLCLHGFPTSSFDYNKIWESLGRQFSLIAFDMIGYGFSDKPRDFNYTTSNQVDILEALISDTGVAKLHILAHDYGNTITQELLARGKERGLNFEIQTVCFMNGALFPETHRPILAQKILISPIGPLFARLIPASKFRASLASVFGPNTQPTEDELDNFMFLFDYNGGRRISHKLIRYMSERTTYRERWVGALADMNQPFRFINGLADPVSGKHLVERFRELFPDRADIIEMEDTGHFPHFEEPELFTEHFLTFHNK